MANSIPQVPAMDWTEDSKLHKCYTCIEWKEEVELQIGSSLSKKGPGAVLLQNSRPVMYVSRALTETEQRYSNIEKGTTGHSFCT